MQYFSALQIYSLLSVRCPFFSLKPLLWASASPSACGIPIELSRILKVEPSSSRMRLNRDSVENLWEKNETDHVGLWHIECTNTFLQSRMNPWFDTYWRWIVRILPFWDNQDITVCGINLKMSRSCVINPVHLRHQLSSTLNNELFNELHLEWDDERLWRRCHIVFLSSTLLVPVGSNEIHMNLRSVYYFIGIVNVRKQLQGKFGS